MVGGLLPMRKQLQTEAGLKILVRKFRRTSVCEKG
jgi:hypothetical protein